jgi:hypothetical protein
LKLVAAAGLAEALEDGRFDQPTTLMLPLGAGPTKVFGPPGTELKTEAEEPAEAVDEALAADAEPVEDAEELSVAVVLAAAAEAVPAEETIADASAGEIVAVLVLAATEPAAPPRASWPSIWG